MTDRQDDSQLRDPQAQMRERFVKQLKEDNFVLYSQPIVPAAQNSADPPLREILARYREEEENLLPPGSFLPILEEQGLLPLLDRWIVARLLGWGRGVQATGRRMPHCTVNLSMDTLRRDEAFGDYVLRGLQKMGVSAAGLTFEIMTEEAIANRQVLARFVPPLRAAGITFALSWFNGEEPGYELIQHLGISYVKIDGAFAATIARQPKKKAELAAIVQRCRKLGAQTICMQVEDEETLQHIRMLRVDYVQGFGIERPRPLEAKESGAA
jgi:Amt family ammonium transporter